MTSSTPNDSELPPAASFYVPSLPGQPESTINSLFQYAGHLPSHPTSNVGHPDSHLWFWLIKSAHVAEREKLVVWFNGGPGCSSLEGALMEIGPLKVKQTPSGEAMLEAAAIGWSEYSNVLFIDQPAGTGYSYVNQGDDVRELAQAADQIVVFLTNFYKIFPEYAKIDTYLAGESFAGQYIPYIAQAILDTTTLTTPLLGILMGNAWINPRIQYGAYLDFMYQKKLLTKGTESANRVEKDWGKCNQALSTKNGADAILLEPCEYAVSSTLDAAAKTIDGVKMVIVPYNVTQFTNQSDTEWPPIVKTMSQYLDQENVVEAFHATNKHSKWRQCNDTVGSQMWARNSAPSSTLLPSLLTKLKVTLYVGDQDYMCNTLGINRSISDLEWNGQKGWGVDEKGVPIKEQTYIVHGAVQGTWTEARGLTFIKFDHASHLVPLDVPFACHDMLLRFMGLDVLRAAGPAGSIPSRIGENETTGVLIKVLTNGSVLSESGTVILPDKTEATIGAAPVLETLEEREAYYGPRQTISLVILLIGLIIGTSFLIRWRRRRKAGRRERRNSKRRQLSESHGSDHAKMSSMRYDGQSDGMGDSRSYERSESATQESRALLQTEEGLRGIATSSRASNQGSPIKHHHQIFALGDEDGTESD